MKAANLKNDVVAKALEVAVQANDKTAELLAKLNQASGKTGKKIEAEPKLRSGTPLT